MTPVNRLGNSTSPYLQQHADNPVAWWPWCDEAFAEARQRQVPILLSVGYAACHWCHVMAHESFSDEAMAARINDAFVAVKVDREERPDIDAVYMQATQAMTGQGGWPMTVFLTPEGQPFFAGTYYPPRSAGGMPGFDAVLDAVAAAWQDRREQVLDSAQTIVHRLAELGPAGGLAADATGIGEAEVETAVRQLAGEFDPVNAGFGSAPKFPPSMVLEALLRYCTHTQDSENAKRRPDDPPPTDPWLMVTQTLEAMARGGIYDQLAGGFARYSVDAAWVVPHFEKMLYDNALLLGVYAHVWRRSEPGSPLAELFGRVLVETVDFLLRELRTTEGGFASSLDADSVESTCMGGNGTRREGAFYVWTPAQLAEALGEDDAAWAASIFSVTVAGTFERGASTLQLRQTPEDQDRLVRIRSALASTREARPRPGRDDKVVAAWNGWLIESLIQAGTVLDRQDWLHRAEQAAQLLWDLHWVGGRLRRASRGGQVGDAPGVLEDYGAVAHAFVRLGSTTASPVWIERAKELLAVVQGQFSDADGLLFDTAADAEQLFSRPRDPSDNATPSGLSSTLAALRLMAEFTGDLDYTVRADRALRGGQALISAAPRFAGWLLADAITQLHTRAGSGPVQIAIAGHTADPRTAALVQNGYRHAPAGSVIVAGEPDTPGIALLEGRPLVDGRPTAYVCRGFACRLPVTTVADLETELRAS